MRRREKEKNKNTKKTKGDIEERKAKRDDNLWNRGSRFAKKKKQQKKHDSSERFLDKIGDNETKEEEEETSTNSQFGTGVTRNMVINNEPKNGNGDLNDVVGKKSIKQRREQDVDIVPREKVITLGRFDALGF